MTTPYHHGSLRQALLGQGRRLLAEQGEQAVTLRELARRTGVSHAAPARHFPDREALLDALAAEGFDELTSALARAAEAGDLQARLGSYASAHVGFALEHPRLLELMFSRKTPPGQDEGALALAAGRFFALGAQLLGEPGPAGSGRLGPLPYVLAGTLEGISSLVVSGRLPRDRVSEVTATAVELLLPAVREQLRSGADPGAAGLGPGALTRDGAPAARGRGATSG